MRIGYVVKRYPRFSETFIVNEILAHEAAGWDVDIFALRPPTDTHFQDMLARVRAPVTYLTPIRPKAAEAWSALGAAVSLRPPLAALERLANAEYRDGTQAARLATLVRERGVEHLHAHFATSQAEVAMHAAGLAQVPFTVTAHAKDIYHESVELDALRRKLAAADGVITVSDFNLRYLTERVPTARIARLYNGIDLREFSFRSEQGREPVVLAAGRLVEKKGFTDLIDACAYLRDTGRAFRCQIVGAGDLQTRLAARIERHRLGGVVSLLGPVPRTELKRMIQDAAIFVAPCVEAADGDRDGLPTVLVEAMALGTPCVATPVTGIPELIEDGRSGVLSPQRDPSALANAVSSLLDDASRRASIAAAARARIERDFDLDQNAATQRELFLSANSRPNREANAA